MNKLTKTVIGCVVAVGVVVAGGDGPGDAKLAGCPEPKVATKVVKAPCPPVVCAECREAATCPECPAVPAPVVKYKTLEKIIYQDAPVRREGEWLVVGSGLYIQGPGLAAGGGYKWANGIMLLGQAAYMDRRGGTDPYVVDVRGHDASPKHVRVPGCEGRGGWGGLATVVIPVKRLRRK